MMNEEWITLVKEVYSVINLFNESPDMSVRGYYERPELLEYLNSYKEKFIKYIPDTLFCAFWYLSLDCIYYPAKSYEEKLEELKVNPG